MKRALPTRIHDQIDRPPPRKSRLASSHDASSQTGRDISERKAPSLLPPAVNYITGLPGSPAAVREPAELLIEGGPGSLTVDLRGMGVALHPAAFAFRMPDDSMSEEQIRCGDIAIVEPCLSELGEGDIVMLALDGMATLRRVTYRGEIAYFQGGQSVESPLLPAWEHAFSGVVAAIFRTFYHGRLLSRAQEPDDVPNGAPAKATKQRKGKKQSVGCENRLRDDPPEASQLNWRSL